MSTATLPPDTTSHLRVLTVTPRYYPLIGGTEIHTYETATRIAAAGNHVTVLTANPGGKLAPEEWHDGVRVIRVPAWPAEGDFGISREIAGVVGRREWDVVHCQGAHTLVPPTAMLAALRAGTPYVVTFHSGGHSSRLRNMVRSSQWAVQRPLFGRAAKLVAVSEFEAAFFRRQLRLASERVAVIPNGVQLSDVPVPSAQPGVGAMIVSVGRLERYKGHHRVIAALPAILERRPDARLRIIGSGPYEAKLRQQARELGLAERVEIGPIPGTDRAAMAAVLSEAAVVTVLSEYESHGIAAIEAISLKRSVLVADSSALAELAAAGLAQAISIDSTSRQVADAILHLIDEPLHPPDINLPSWDDCASRLIDVYRSVLGRPVCAS
jgi:glycosyltransferase involved in cell wall biosynthesis